MTYLYGFLIPLFSRFWITKLNSDIAQVLEYFTIITIEILRFFQTFLSLLKLSQSNKRST